MSEQPDPVNEPEKGFFGNPDWVQTSKETMDYFLSAADIDAVYGEPIEQGDSVIIPTAEIMSVMGFGFGGGGGMGVPEPEKGNTQPAYGGGNGGGGGGRILSRPVAVIVASPQGVEVKPVVDVTKLGLAALTAFGFMVGMYARMSSRRQMMRAMKEQMRT